MCRVSVSPHPRKAEENCEFNITRSQLLLMQSYNTEALAGFHKAYRNLAVNLVNNVSHSIIFMDKKLSGS